MYSCVRSCNVCIHVYQMRFKFVSYELVLESRGGKKGRFQWKETVKASLNIRLVRFGLVMSVDQEHRNGMDHIASAPIHYDSSRPHNYAYHCIKRMNVTSLLLSMCE
jgi:hypothetical protein